MNMAKNITKTLTVAIATFAMTISPAFADDFLNDKMDALENQIDIYKEIVSAGGWPSLGAYQKLELGSQSANVATLREVLTLTGDLEKQSTSFWDRDSKKQENISANMYDERLEQAVKNFQARHGLEVDGIIGPNTHKALAVPAVERLAQLMVAKQELTSFIQTNGEFEDGILVNLPGYTLYGLNNGKKVEEMRVIVGSTRHRTPLFSNQIEYVEFNPTWIVPQSIATKEMLGKIKNDPSYVSRAGFKLTQNGQHVDATSVNWDEYDRGNFPFRLTQRSGSGNALGKVKFMIPNNSSIYLHDTAQRHLFEKDYRALSHGCIRVQDPQQLARYVMGYGSNMSGDEVDATYNDRSQHRVTLEKPITVHAVYWTAWVDDSSKQPYFYDDVYRKQTAQIADVRRQLEGVVEMAAN